MITCPDCGSIKILTIKRTNNGLGGKETADENNRFNSGKAEFRLRREDCRCSSDWETDKDKIAFNRRNLMLNKDI